MKLGCHSRLAAVAIAVTTATLTASAARAEEPLFGFSLDLYGAPVVDHAVTITNQAGPRDRSQALFGLATLLNWDGLALGAAVDGISSGRVSGGALAGWQPRVGSRLYQVLGELGQERFSVGGGFLSSSTPQETTLGYVGGRLGMTQTFGQNNPFELGAWLFFRRHMGEANLTTSESSWFGGEDTVTEYRLGGYSAGLALRIGVRFDQKRPSNQSTVEVQYEPAKS